MSFAEFFERARIEAARYGPDPWIFVRELLQNARDAGATRVEFEVSVQGGRTRVTCHDDGEGMDFAHARAYLFSLYASSKESDQSSVGKFGVGFWSILRFDPEQIWIRSRARGAPAWEIELHTRSDEFHQRQPAFAGGTQIVLEREGEDHEALRRLRDAVRQNARFVRQRGREEPLEVHVQGERLNAAFELPSPVATFKMRGGRGVVALGDRPQVELFSQGLRVRAASCLEDLLSEDRASERARVRFPSVDGIMAPQVLLEADHVEPLLSRSEARDDAQLRKLVARAQAQLRRLVRRQLNTLRPPGLRERVAELFRSFGEAPVGMQVAVAALLGATVALLLAPLFWRSPGVDAAPKPSASASAHAGGLAAYSDLSATYQGPQVSELDPARAQRLDMRYSPADRSLFFGLLTVEDFSAQAARESGLTQAAYQGGHCASTPEDCVRVSLAVDAKPGPLRVPMPAGYRLDLDSLDLNGTALQVAVVRSESDEAVLMPGVGLRGELHYTAAPGPSQVAPASRAPALPAELARTLPELRAIQDLDARVARALEIVRTRVVYSVEAATANAHAQARNKGLSFLERALVVGAGDCDVQNGTLAALLQASGMHARLVVGVVGSDGRARPWLHAWLEYRDAKGYWRVADASEGATIPGLDASELRQARVELGPADAAAKTAELSASPPLALPVPSSERPLSPNAELARADPGPTLGQPGQTPAQGQTSSHGEIGPPVAGSPNESETSPSVVRSTRGPQVGEAGPPGWRARLATLIGDVPPFLPALVTCICGIAALLLMLMLMRTRQGRVRVHADVDLAQMLQGALRQPQAFRQLPELFTRRLVPQRKGRSISLSAARQLSAAGELYWSSAGAGLGADAARAGKVVLDGRAPEAVAVALSLGAIDLDELDTLGELAAMAQADPLCAQLERELEAQGAHWRFVRVDGLKGRVRSVDLLNLGVARKYKAHRIVFVDRDDAVFEAANSTHARYPERALFALLDDLLARLDVQDERRAELLRGLATKALLAPDEDGGARE